MKLESLEELRVFSQIVESGSLTAAARALGLPPNTVSRRLASLEERLDVKLLHRTTRSLSLSEAGRALLSRARRILDEVDAAELAVQRETEGLTGVVQISLMSILTVPDTLAVLRLLMDEHPGLRLQIQVNDRPVNPVAEGLDVVVFGGTLSDSTLTARKLTSVQPLLAASTAYIDRHGAPHTPEDLLRHETLHFLSAGGTFPWNLTGPDGEQHVVHPEGRFEANDGRALFDAMVSGLGIGWTSARMMRSAPNLRQVLADYTLPSFPLYAIYPSANRRSARLQTVVAALHAAVVEA
ncbi:MAG: LysR family transcriptional regulator [Proteobacteria bacterium]|nr:LysR family transcriptional regulator [Pseudomonadota bacterium]MCP4917380.1 LysR family transcriptional regulator [Pseudomonadota bacterium]